METIKAQGEEINSLQAMIQNNTSQQTFSEVTTYGGTSTRPQTSQTRSTPASSSQIRKERPQAQDERAVSGDLCGLEGAKNNYEGKKDGLRAGT